MEIGEIAKEIWQELGPGFSERVYHNAFEVGLRERGIKYETERIILLFFKNRNIGNLRADLIVGDTVVELKATTKLKDENRWQCRNYMKLLSLPKGVLINFGPTLEIECLQTVNEKETAGDE
jgi:GxxExxY protein